MNREMQKKEAIKRLELLEKEFEGQLNPDILKYFKEGKPYYSYLTVDGTTGSIDAVDSDPGYAELVSEFEKQHEALVFHVILSGTKLSMLYVGSYEDEWDFQRKVSGGVIFAYVYNMVYPELSEFGSIQVGVRNGALVLIK